MSATSDKEANQFWLCYGRPFSAGESNWLLSTSLPLNTYPAAPTGGHQTRLGNLNLFAAWLIDTGNPAVSFDFGSQITAPTASRNALG